MCGKKNGNSTKQEKEHEHEHEHEHGHGHEHGHEHEHEHHGPIVTVRALSGLSGDMMLTGFAALGGISQKALDALVRDIGCTGLEGSVRLGEKTVNEVTGWTSHITLPHEHAHRTCNDIHTIIAASNLEARAKQLACATFSLLAEAEGAVHGKTPQAVTFHEVGALDSIIDICLVCALYVRLAPARFVCSPLPLADGEVWCAHGCLPTPAPAVFRLLEGVPVCGFSGKGETVTPTAIALLKTLGAEYGPWPTMHVQRTALVYGGKYFANAPNGSLWALGLNNAEAFC